MRTYSILLIFALAIFPLYANTHLQNGAEKAQNFLERTFSRANHAWIMMQYHFFLGNEKLKETANNTAPALKK